MKTVKYLFKDQYIHTSVHIVYGERRNCVRCADNIHAEVNIVYTMDYTLFIRVKTHHKEFYYPLD